MANKKISQLIERTKLTGNEMLPFQEGNYNGKIRSSLLTSLSGSGDDLQKIRSTKGQIVASYGNGVIRNVIHENNQYYLQFDEPISYVAGDILNCTTYSKNNKKNYSLVISNIKNNYVIISESQYEQTKPQAGDETVQIGNANNKRRAGIVTLTAAPNENIGLDCYSDIYTANSDGQLRVRVGDLDGIYDSFFKEDNQPNGYGLYGNNCFLVGDFLLRDGSDIADIINDLRFEISNIVYEINATNNYLSNATFANNLDKWQYENNIQVFKVNQKLLYFNNNFYSNKASIVDIISDDNRNAVKLKNSYILQYNDDYAKHPTFDDSSARSFNIQFRYKVLKPGILTIYFKNEQQGDFEDYEKINYTRQLNTTSVFNTLNINGKWNGTGDFYLGFTGEILIHSVILSDDSLGDLEDYVNEQIHIVLDKVVKTEEKLEEYRSELIFTAEQLRIEFDKKITDTKENITSEYTSLIELTAENLRVEFGEKITNVKNEITEEYTSAINLSAQELTVDFTKKITDNKEEITKEYTSAIELSAEQLTINFDQKVTHLDETLEEYHSEFLLTAQEFTTRFERNEQTITTLEDTTTGLTQTTTNIQKDVSEIKQDLNSITLRVSSTEQNIVTITDKTNNLEQTDAKQQEDISQIKLEIGNINLSVSSNTNEISSLKNKTTGLEQTTQTITRQISEINLDIDSITLKVSKNESTITNLEGKTNTISSDVAQIKLDTEKIESSVTSISSKVDSNTGRIESLEAESAGWVTTAEGNTLWAAKGQTEADIKAAKDAAEDAASDAYSAYSKATNAENRANNAYNLADDANDKATANATAIKQTSDYISLISGNFDSDGDIINAAGWVTTSEANTLWVRKDNVISSINQTAESVEINAEKIDFVGKTVINGKFIVDTSGNVTLNNLTATGKINADSGRIGDYLFLHDRGISTNSTQFIVNASRGNTQFELSKNYYLHTDSYDTVRIYPNYPSGANAVLEVTTIASGSRALYVGDGGAEIKNNGYQLKVDTNGIFITGDYGATWGKIPVILAICTVYGSSASANPTVSMSYKTPGSSISVSASRQSEGYYKLNLSGLNSMTIYPIVIGMGSSRGKSLPQAPIKATLGSYSSTTIYVATSDDETPNDGDFKIYLMSIF